MGLRDMIRRRRADAEPQGEDFTEEFVVPAEQTEPPKEVRNDVANDQKG